MKHLRSLLLLPLISLLCECTKQQQTEPYLRINDEQAIQSKSDRLKNIELSKNETDTLLPTVPQQFFDNVAELVKPLQDKLGKTLVELNSGLYESYQKDMAALSKVSSDDEKAKLVSMMKENYYTFILEGWKKAGIDEEAYKKKIASLLPREMRELIRFDNHFLNFYFDILRPPGSATWVPRMKDIDRWEFDDDDTPAAPPPASTCQWVEGKVYYPNLTNASKYLEKFLSADAEAYGLYSNGIFARANTWPVLGRGLGRITLVSNVYPQNNGCNKLKVRKTIKWEATLYAFTFYGHLTVSTAEYNTGFTSGNVTAVAPVIWFHERSASRTFSEEYTMNKGDYREQFGANVKATVTSEGVFSHGSSKTSLTIPSWTLTELCCK